MIEWGIFRYGESKDMSEVPDGARVISIHGQEVYAYCEDCGEPVLENDDYDYDDEGAVWHRGDCPVQQPRDKYSYLKGFRAWLKTVPQRVNMAWIAGADQAWKEVISLEKNQDKKIASLRETAKGLRHIITKWECAANRITVPWRHSKVLHTSNMASFSNAQIDLEEERRELLEESDD